MPVDTPAPPKPRPAPHRIHSGGEVEEALLVHRVEPRYPTLARQIRLEGTVRLHAVIGVDGSVRELEVESGHPLLARAAREAVLQWRYRPTRLNGEPVEVDTTITVIFELGP
jgi:protein TonB